MEQNYVTVTPCRADYCNPPSTNAHHFGELTICDNHERSSCETYTVSTVITITLLFQHLPLQRPDRITHTHTSCVNLINIHSELLRMQALITT